MGIFDSAYNKVEKHSTGIKDLNRVTRMSNGMAAKETLSKLAVMEANEEIEKSMDKAEKEDENKKANSKIANQQLKDSKVINKANDIAKEGRDTLFKEIMFEMFKKSLYLDEEFILENYDNLRLVTDSYIDKNGGYNLLKKATESNNSTLLRNIYTLCENTVKEVCQRKLRQSKEDSVNVDDVLNFDLDDDEDKKFSYEKSKLGVDELADLVKQKVLTVVQDEKNRQVKDDELNADIENELKDNEAVTDEKTAKEALTKILINKNPVEETTLFAALMRNSYKELLKENNTAIMSDFYMSNEKEEDTRNYDVNMDKDDIKKNEYKEQDSVTVKRGDYSLSEEIAEAENNNEEFLNKEEFSIDMDMVLAEAITKYTLLEVLYTSKLEKYDPYEIRKMTEKLLR